MMQRPDRKIVIEKATVPVLFVIGEDDNAIPMKDMLEQSQLPENAYIHILHHSGHMGMLEESLNSSQILNKYLGDIYPKHNSDRSDQ
jgi:poly(3-hydroxyalkanoate) synthetase